MVKQSLKIVVASVAVLSSSYALAADTKQFDGLWQYSDAAFQAPVSKALMQSESAWYSSPGAAYKTAADTLHNLYQKAKFVPAVTESYFPDSKLYKMVALPMVAVPYLEDGYQVELFGQFYNKQRNDLLNLGSDDPMYNYYAGSSSAELGKDFAIGLGTSYIVNKDITLQSMLSSGAIPNHGNSKLAIGINVSF